MTDEQKPPQWSVQDGPDGPVEALTTFRYMRHWLHSQEGNRPAAVRELLIAWCREHPEPTLDSDPRGHREWASSTSVRLADDGFVTIGAETHVGRGADRNRVGSVTIRRLPHRALSSQEARGVADELMRVVQLVEEDEQRPAGKGRSDG